MKRNLSIAFTLVAILLISSCGKRQYAHLTHLKLHTKKENTRVKQYSHYVKSEVDKTVLEQQKEVVQSSFDTSVQEQNIVFTEQLKVQENEIKESSNQTVINRLNDNTELDNDVAKNDHYRYAAPINKKVKRIVKKAEKLSKKSDQGLLYWILVVLLILLLLTLLKEILGALYPLLILVVLIFLLGHLLGWW